MVNGVLDTFIDESSDREQRNIFCVAAVLANEFIYKPLEEKWTERLNADGIDYFRASDCRSVHGAFEHLRKKCGSLEAAKKVADAVWFDLESLLLTSPWLGFSTGVIIPEYKAVWEASLEARRCYAKDPTVAAYHQTMYEVTRTVRKKAKGFQVMFVVDDSTYSDKIRDAFKGMKINHPTIGSSAKGCIPLNDKDTPALQMADLFASITKDLFLQAIKQGGKYMELGKWHNHIDRIGKLNAEAMLNSLRHTFNSPRFLKGTIARQHVPEPKITKGEKKRIRRALWKNNDPQEDINP